MEIVWPVLLALLVSVTIIALNILLLLIILTDSSCQSTSNIISCNLWLSNLIFGVVTLFFYSSFNIDPNGSTQYRATTYYVAIPSRDLRGLVTNSAFDGHPNKQPMFGPRLMPTSNQEFDKFALLTKALMDQKAEDNMKLKFSSTNDNAIFTAPFMAALFNSTMTLMALLSGALAQIFPPSQSNKRTPLNISMFIWSLMFLILTMDFIVISKTRSISFVTALQITLMCIVLMFNLALHPINILKAEMKCSITEALWLAIYSLSFILLITLFIWHGLQQLPIHLINDRNYSESNKKLFLLQISAYGLHCVANPIIALQRDRNLMTAAVRILCNKWDSHGSVDIESRNEEHGIPHFYVLPPPPYKEINPTRGLITPMAV